ncbi:MAG: efflux RND transporter periplasmic adaptor subunit [Steroidobacteraceae bacterium]
MKKPTESRSSSCGARRLLLPLLLAATLTACSGKAAEPAVELPLVTVLAPGLSDVTTSVEFTGTINARDETAIAAEGEGARIAAVLVEAGDRVRRGQLLARLDTSVAQPQLRSIEAALAEARAAADLAAAEARRAEEVAASGALSAQEIERRRSAAVSAEAKVQVAAAQLAESRARLARTEIRAPSDGIILTRDAEVGQLATPSSGALFRLGRGGAIEMRGVVAEQDLPALAPGQLASVRITGVERAFEGKVRLIGAVIDPQTRLGSVRIDLPSDPQLRPGAFARAQVSVSRDQRPVLPQTALLADERGNYVLIVADGDKVERRDVQVDGTRTDGIVISAGLTGSERVVTTAGAFLREGERVRTVSAAASPAPGGAKS